MNNENQSNELPDRAEEKRVDVPHNTEPVETPNPTETVVETTTEQTVTEKPADS